MGYAAIALNETALVVWAQGPLAKGVRCYLRIWYSHWRL
jgi:hypothetical protein